MIRLEYKTEPDYPDDVKRMRDVLYLAGYEVSDSDICLAWRDYCSTYSYSRGLRLPEDDTELLNILLQRLTNTDE